MLEVLQNVSVSLMESVLIARDHPTWLTTMLKVYRDHLYRMLLETWVVGIHLR
jgi:hypothetical protein